MQLYILDEFPLANACELVNFFGPKYAHKMLVELSQLVSSVLGGKEVRQIYDKKIPQGKCFQKFIKDNPSWICRYMYELLDLCLKSGIKIKPETQNKYKVLINDLLNTCKKLEWNIPEMAPFRYSKDYKSNVETDTFLDIEDCVSKYLEYAKYKKQQLIKSGYIKE